MGLISVSVSRPGIEQRFDGFPLRMREGKQTSLGFPKLEKTLSTQLYHGLFSKRSSSVAYQCLFYPMIDLLMTIRSRAASSIYVPNCIHFKKCTGHSEKGSLSPNARHLAQNQINQPLIRTKLAFSQMTDPSKNWKKLNIDLFICIFVFVFQC